jgi:hypothetical protein
VHDYKNKQNYSRKSKLIEMAIIKDLQLKLAAVPLDAACGAAAMYTWADA